MATNLVIDAKLSKWVYQLNNSGNAALNIDGWRPVQVTRFNQTSANFAAPKSKGSASHYFLNNHATPPKIKGVSI